MKEYELVLIAIGLAMDAFAVAVCRGLSMEKMNYRQAFFIAFMFGGFQAVMPLAGFFLGTRFEAYITSFDHWIAFILLSVIGLKMLKESGSSCPATPYNCDSLNFKTTVVMAIATSIDALAVGVTFAFLQVKILPAVSIIGIITFLISFAGVKIGNVFGDKYQKKAEIAGGIILILIGAKILADHVELF